MSEEILEKSVSNWSTYNPGSHKDIKKIIRDNINSVCANYVAIGYYLNVVNDRKLYEEDGYSGIGEYAAAEYGISKDKCSYLMKIADKFCIPNSPALKPEYRDFTVSKLREMIYLTDEQLEQITVSTTVAEIREIRKPENVAMSQLGPESVKSVSTLKKESEKQLRFPKVCKWDGKSNCVAICDTGAECCAECKDHGHCNSECGWQDERIPKVSRQCIHRPEYPCTLSEAQKVAKCDGIDCNVKCCWGCCKHGICGYKCNSSAQRPKDIPKTVKDKPETVDNRSEIVNDVDENEQCSKCTLNDNADAEILECHTENGEHKCWTADEQVQVETIEADIIQTVPEDPELYTYEDVKDELDKLTEYVETFRMNNDVVPGRRKAKMRLDAIIMLSNEMKKALKIDDHKPTQLELPILKNNDQRKAFIEAYESWPIWIDIKETKERYYRHDLNNGSYMVVKVYFRKGYSWGSLKKEDHWGSNEYYLIESPESHFKDCQTNMTALIEYLKDIQKKRPNHEE